MRVSAMVALAIAACSGQAEPPGEGSAAGSGLGPRASGLTADAAVAAVAATTGSGDLEIHVEWADVPVARRASPGRSACGTARPGELAPSTTWGIPDVIVLLDAGAGAPDARSPQVAAAPRIVARDCELVPRAQVAAVGATLTLASGTEAPVALAVAHLGAPSTPAALAAIVAPGASGTDVELPVIGHAVEVALAASEVDAIAWRDGGGDPAWVVAWPHAAAVTDRNGQVTLRGLPAGPHDIVAWLPPRAGFPAAVAHGAATVAAGELVSATLSLATGGSAGSAGPATP
jgi:hypothetical protein